MGTQEAAQLMGASAFLGASLAVVGIISLVFYVLLVIAFWKMFTKAGEPGWKSLIPIYDAYIAFKIAWKDGPKNFWICFGAFIVTFVAAAFMRSPDGSMNIIAAVITLAASIVALIWEIRFLVKQAYSYNKGILCAILAIFFTPLVMLYYGFSSNATYIGPQD